MNVLDLKVDWHPKSDAAPSLQLLIDEVPKDLVYTDRHPFYFAEKDGFVSFFYYDRTGNGYGRRTFNIKTHKEEVKLVGPWSSNPAAMSAAGFISSVDVTMTDKPKDFKRGYTLFAARITVELAEMSLEKFARGCTFAQVGGVRTIVKTVQLPYLISNSGLHRGGDARLSEPQNFFTTWGMRGMGPQPRPEDTPIRYRENWIDNSLLCGAGPTSKGEDGCNLPSDHTGYHGHRAICGAYKTFYMELGKPDTWQGCLQEPGHEGNHGEKL